MARALRELSEAVLVEAQLDLARKAEVLDAIEEVSDGARVTAPERRTARIMRAIGHISTAAGAATALGKVWDQYGQKIVDYFQHLPRP